MHPAWRRFLAAFLPLLVFAMTACGMIPYHNPNHREEGAGRGLLTGSSGEWVIYRKEEAAPRSHSKHTETERGDTDRTPLEK